MYNNATKLRAGFTLVEILAVVVILGIASAIIVPQINSRDDLKASAAARTIIADLIYAQNLAISTQTKTYVRFDVANNRYSLVTSPTSASGTFGTPVNHPLTQTSYVTQFGATARGWETVKLDTVTMNGLDPSYRPEFTVGFDEIGTPYVFCYDVNLDNELYNGTIVVKSGTYPKTITIQAATGEINVD